MAASKDLERLADRVEQLERRNAEQQAEIAALKRAQEPVAPKPEPPHVRLPDGRTVDRVGNAMVAGPHAGMGTGVAYTGEPSVSQQVAGGYPDRFYRTMPDGTTVFAPDGVPRDAATGEVLSSGSGRAAAPIMGTGQGTPGPRRMDLAIIDAMTPLGPVRRPPDDAA